MTVAVMEWLRLVLLCLDSLGVSRVEGLFGPVGDGEAFKDRSLDTCSLGGPFCSRGTLLLWTAMA